MEAEKERSWPRNRSLSLLFSSLLFSSLLFSSLLFSSCCCLKERKRQVV